MADEASVRASLQIITENGLEYQSRPSSFNADVSAGVGPTPGRVLATVAGVDVDLSAIVVPGGLYRVQNLDATNFVELGIWDGVSFFPFNDILVGESYIGRLAASAGDEFGTGTGTTTADVNTYRLKADTASCECLFEAFDK